MLNLAPKCRAEFRLPVDIQFERYSWDFYNQKIYKEGACQQFQRPRKVCTSWRSNCKSTVSILSRTGKSTIVTQGRLRVKEPVAPSLMRLLCENKARGHFLFGFQRGKMCSLLAP